MLINDYLYLGVCLVTQLYLTLYDPMDYSPTGSSVHGILQARILKCVAIPFSRGSSWPRDWTHSLLHSRWILYCRSRQRSSIYIYDSTNQEHIINYQVEWLTLYLWSTEMWSILILHISADQLKKGIQRGKQGITQQQNVSNWCWQKPPLTQDHLVSRGNKENPRMQQ